MDAAPRAGPWMARSAGTAAGERAKGTPRAQAGSANGRLHASIDRKQLLESC
jgi:hypothetical protein